NERMDAYFAMTRPDQQKQLDDAINRMLQRQKEQQQNPAGGNGNGNGRRGGNGGRNMTAAQRESRAKQRLDNSTPKERAQRAEYRKQLELRMQQRGLDPKQLAGNGRLRMA